MALRFFFDKPFVYQDGVMMTEKAFVVLHAMYNLGGKASSKQIFDVIDLNDRQRFNIQKPVDVMWYLKMKKNYVSKVYDEKGEMYMRGFGGKYRRVFRLRKKVIPFFEKYANTNKLDPVEQ